LTRAAGVHHCLSQQPALGFINDCIFTDLFKEVGHPRAIYLSPESRTAPGGPVRDNKTHEQASVSGFEVAYT